MKRVLAIAVAIALAAAALLTWSSVARTATNTPGCGNCLYSLGSTVSSLTGCDADSGCTVQDVGPDGSTNFHDEGTATGVSIGRPGATPAVQVFTDHLSASFWQTVTAAGLVTGAGQLTLTNPGNGTVDLQVPITVSGTTTHLIYDSTGGGTFHLQRQSEGTKETGSGTGVFHFISLVAPPLGQSATALTSGANPVPAGYRFALTATQCSRNGSRVGPTGAITFTDTSTGGSIGSSNLVTKPANACSAATIGVIPAAGALGDHIISAHYTPGGSTPYAPSADATLTETVVIDHTTTAVSPAANPETSGQQVIVGYTVCNTDQPITPTGHVHIADIVSGDLGDAYFQTRSGGCTSGSTALNPMTPGVHHLTLTYVPHIPGFASSSASYDQRVGDSVAFVFPGTGATPSTPIMFTTVQLDGKVCDFTNNSTTPTGALHFSDQTANTDLGTVALAAAGGGCARAGTTTEFSSPGRHTVRIDYVPDAGFNPTANTVSVDVQVQSGG